MRATSCGSKTRGVVVVCALFALYALPPGADAQTPTSFTDFTEYTYSVPAGPRGSFADFRVTRTFTAPIVSLRVFIVSGRADDIGYVGSRLVTNIPGACVDVGTVTSQEVTDQVTFSGNTATFLLRAQENCCCVTGWGSATQADRANARFQWVVTLGSTPCQVAPLTPITDPAALPFEQGNPVDTANLTAAMQTALSCLQQLATANGGSVRVESAYRPAAYQAHLREVWDRWNDLRNNRDPGCAALRTAVQQEFGRHRLQLTQRPAVDSDHSRGAAFDANWTLPAGVSIDTLAANCNLRRPLIATDPGHFIAR